MGSFGIDFLREIIRRNRGCMLMSLLLCCGAFYILHEKRIENEELLKRFENAKPMLPSELHQDISYLRWKITREKLKARILDNEMIALRKSILKFELKKMFTEIEMLDEQEEILKTPDITNFLPHLRSGLSVKPKMYLSRELQRHNYSLAFGITVNSAPRIKFLLRTLNSLIENLEEKDTSNVVFVVYINVPKLENAIVQRLKAAFDKQILDGLIEIVVPPYNYYPPDLNKLLLEENAELSTVNSMENAKRVLDHSYLMFTVQTKALFYVQLDDDIQVKPKYVRKIQTFAFDMSTKTSTDYWFELSFSTLPCVGKLYRTSDIGKLSTFYLMYYKHRKCDNLVSGLIAGVSCSMENNTCSRIVKNQRVQYRPELFSRSPI